MNIIKKFMESGSKQELVSIPAGQLFLLRSRQSPKSSSECLYDDATLTVRESGHHAYELIVRKSVEEDISSPFGEDADDDEEDGNELSGNLNEDEWVFKLDHKLHLHKNWNKTGDLAIVWRNTKGDKGENFEFVVNSDISLRDIEHFLQAIYRCEYETKYKRSSNSVSDEDLKQFDFSYLAADDAAVVFSDDDEGDVRDTELLPEFSTLSINTNNADETDEEDVDEYFGNDDGDVFEDAREEVDEPRGKLPTPPPQASNSALKFLQYGNVYVYDPIAEKYILQETNVKVSVVNTDDFQYWLHITGEDFRLSTFISPEVNPILEQVPRSLTFNYSHDTVVLSYKVTFKNEAIFNHFQNHWTIALWESLNMRKWSDLLDFDQNYILNAMVDKGYELDEFLKENNAEKSHPTQEEEDSDYEEEGDEEEAHEEEAEFSKRVIHSSHLDDEYDSYDEDKAEKEYMKSTSLLGNKSLTIGYKLDRSYIIRDNRLGVFKANDDGLSFVTSIGNISNLKGEGINPESTMLFTEDRAMILQDPSKKDTLYKMDLERGKVVEEWRAKDNEIVQFGPSKKFDQLTNEQTFLGLSKNSIFRMDQRINGPDKIVTDEQKSYKSPNNFSSVCSTQLGLVAVGSETGEIRLYDKINMRAKTLIPALGQPIRHLCASADGKWLLATCKSSLLLVDTEIKSGKNAGSLAYNKPFSKGDMPKVYVLKVDAATAMYMQQQSGKPISFTKASFNTGIGTKEQTISTSTGQFAMVWPIINILRGKRSPYVIRKYASPVMEEGFKFGSDNNLIVTLKDDVAMVNKRSFKAPSKKIFTSEPILKNRDKSVD
ncbi:HHR062Cp [Eremothecium sinecaudum]|uniref:HHR062Cp n=1 Tax=Eremothecium sinecaudum TaxID=45286 RepID=A0A109UYL8_9SACH|nr:HHR062Cp [Eremothecium sinecaudum]AMD22831.1 HHR062Cp [Eremothecium sinecaudum]